MKEILKELAAMQVKMPIETVFIVLLIACLVAFIIFLTYKHTYTGVLYNPRFNVSLVMITLVTTMVMVVIGSNISVSLGMVGALSIIRFRTAVKDPRDTAFIFWAVATGLACGTQNYTIVLIASAVICALMFVFKRVTASSDKYSLIVKGNNFNIKQVENVLEKSVKGFICKGKYVTSKSIELIYEIKLNKNTDENNIISHIGQVEGIDTINIVSSNTDILG